MKLLERVIKENHWIIEVITWMHNKYLHEELDKDPVTSQYIWSKLLQWRRWSLQIKHKEILIWYINELLGSSYSIYELEKKVWKKNEKK